MPWTPPSQKSVETVTAKPLAVAPDCRTCRAFCPDQVIPVVPGEETKIPLLMRVLSDRGVE
jgi:Pyruvate/2-oxoacid:ferredoxin oxidoreductase delta subunit